MLQRPSRKLYLADLVMAALLCGLVMAIFTAVRGPTDAAIVGFLILGVVTWWVLFREGRRSPTCVECGRRFIRPSRSPTGPSPCPHCGREQVRLIRSIRRVKRVIWSLLGLLALLVVVVGILINWSSDRPFDAEGMVGGLIAISGLPLMYLALIGAGIYRSILMRPKDRPCEGCGGIIPAEPPAGPAICPRCQLRHLRPEQVKEEHAKSLRVMILLFGMLGILGTFVLALWGGSPAGMSPWIGVPLIFLASAALPFLALVLLFTSIHLQRRRQLRSERGTLAMARKYAGREGEVVSEGALTIWYSGPEDPAPMLREQRDAARRRFEALTGGAAAPDGPLRILVFHDRGAFLRFHMPILAGFDLAGLDGVFLGHPYWMTSLCTAPAACRLTDPEKTIRLLAGYGLVDTAWGPNPPAWLRAGLSRAVAVDEDRDGPARLNRKMVAALSAGIALSTEIFSISIHDLTRLFRGTREFRHFQRYQQLNDQAWSIVESLCGASAPHDRRESLGAFLRDPRSKTDQEASFRLHFGLGFEPLLDVWRRWVMERGIGDYGPPPDRVRDGLLGRVLPAIRDRRATRGDRILAIREWADAGSVLGADALIDLLRDPGDIPKEEVVWALGMASGMAWGDEPDRWQAWWDDLPTDWDGPPETTPAPSDGLAAGRIAAGPDAP
jgi:hypothetical protein